MGRFRSLLTRFIKPAAMVGTVGILSLGLVVTTPSNAHALVKYPKIPVNTTFITGAVKTVGPAAMAVASFTPVGWGLRLFQLGMLAYSTSDIWMPYVTGTFGSDNPAVPGTGTGYGNPDPNFRMGAPTVSGSVISHSRLYTCSNSAGCGLNHHEAYIVECKNPTTGAITVAKGIVSPIQGTAPLGTSSMGTFSLTCANATIPVGGLFGLAGSGQLPLLTGTQRVTGPSNDVSYGTIQGPKSFNPNGDDVTYQGKSECIDSAGTISWVSGPMIPGNNGAMLMPSCEAAGKGHGTGRTKVEAFKPDGTTETVWDTGPSPLADPATPLCDPGRSTSGCVMEITKDGQPCTTGDVECENWASEAPKDGTGTRWKCKFGPYTLSLSSCGLLERAYVPGGSPLNDPNTDGNPDTKSPLGPDSQPAPPVAPVVTGTVPGSPTPGAPGAPGPGSDTSTRQCWPTGWGMFNPLEWVLKPLRCAFEPTKNIAAEGGALRDKALTKAPLSFVAAISATAPASVGGQGACPSWVVHISSSGGGVDGAYSKNVVCDSSFIQSIVNARPVLFGLISGAMLWPFLRSLWYAIIPIVRVVPTGGK